MKLIKVKTFWILIIGLINFNLHFSKTFFLFDEFIFNLAQFINCTSFVREVNREISEIDPTIILKKSIYKGKYYCLIACKKTTYCEYAGFNSSICILYSAYAQFYLKQGLNLQLFRKKDQKKYF